MGYDCTYHLVDATRVADALGALSAKAGRAPRGFAAAYGRGSWTVYRKAILEGEPAEAAKAACALAIRVSALALPHAAQRGIAFSRGLSGDDDEQPPLAASERGAPERLLAPLLRARPVLRGHFPIGFESNYEAGILIEAPNVSRVAASTRKRMLARRQASLRAMVWTLEAAASHGLAWWEATDLDVPQTHAELLGPEPELPPLPPEPELAPYREYQPGEIGIHPSLGAVEVLGREMMEIHGAPQAFLVVRRQADGTRLTLPVAQQAWMRLPTASAEIDAVFHRLRNPEPGSSGWSLRRHRQALEGGAIDAIANVAAQLARDARTKTPSYSERAMLFDATSMLAREVAASLGVTPDEAARRIEACLRGGG